MKGRYKLNMAKLPKEQEINFEESFMTEEIQLPIYFKKVFTKLC